MTVSVHDKVAEARGTTEPLGKVLRDHSRFRQQAERIPARRRAAHAKFDTGRDSHVDHHLDGLSQVQDHGVRRGGIRQQIARVGR